MKNNKTPVFFVDSKQIKVQFYVVYRASDNLILSASPISIESDDIQALIQKKYTFYFTKPNYDEINRYRQMAMYIDRKTQQTMVNPFKLRNYIILNHLKRWQGVTDQDGNQIELKLDQDGTLTASSLQLIFSINPSVMDVAMTNFEQKAMLI